ncbi:MAG TPA: SH3 domain-containing protein [Bacteroidales bacterium]|nr:SH3 domain-containing protein [Bacteroidales bacterium]
MKKLKFLLVFFLLICSFVLNAQSKTVNVKTLNVRSEPNTTSEIILKLNYGDEVVVISSSNGWDYVKINNFRGYVLNKHLKDKQSSSTSNRTSTTSKSKEVESYVLICNSSSAYAYHTHYCKGLRRCKSEVSKVTVSNAQKMGYKPCGFCY